MPVGLKSYRDSGFSMLCSSKPLFRERPLSLSLPQSIQFEDQIIHPGKIICIGRNYVEHIEELGNEIPEDMVVFLKPNSAIGTQLSSFDQEPLHYEGEICFLVNNGSFCAAGFGLDITRRSLQGKLKQKGLPWERAKAFDGSALFSPFTAIDNWEGLSLQLDINSVTIQSGNVSLMMYKPDTILQQLSRFMTVNDGDIVMTGTPRGVGEIQSGDRFCGQILQSGTIITQQQWLAV